MSKQTPTRTHCKRSRPLPYKIQTSRKPWYTSIQMKCQGGVIFVHAPRLFYYPKRRIGYARCSLTGNKNYPAITKPTNTMKGYATSWHAVWPTKHCTWLAIYPVYEQRRLMNG